MRNFVIGISNYGRSIKPNFIVIPQNGNEVMTSNGELNGKIDKKFMEVYFLSYLSKYYYSKILIKIIFRA